MHRYIPIYSKIWSDKKFQNLPSSLSKLILIYLIANDELTLTGIYDFEYQVCMKRMNAGDEFHEAFQAIVDSGIVKWDAENEIIWVVNRFKYIVNKNGKVLDGALEELNHIEHKFRDEFLRKYRVDVTPYIHRLKEESSNDDFLREDNVKNILALYNSKE